MTLTVSVLVAVLSAAGVVPIELRGRVTSGDLCFVPHAVFKITLDNVL